MIGLTFNLWRNSEEFIFKQFIYSEPATSHTQKKKKKTNLIQPLNVIFSFWYSHQEENNFILLKASTEVEKRKQLSHLQAYNVKLI